MAGGARGRGVPFAHHFGAGNANVMDTRLGAAFLNMKDLIQEYETIQITRLKDLKERFSMQEIGSKLCQAILKNDKPVFDQIIGIVEIELE
jgi:hypothetical protein